MVQNYLCFCLTTKHLETKLNHQKQIKFYEIHPKKYSNRYKHFWTLQPVSNLNPLATFIGKFYEPRNDIFQIPAHWTF